MTPTGAVRDRLDHAADSILADRAADGDARAFAVLVGRYSRLLRWYAVRIVDAGGAEDDIVQDTWITAWQQLPTLTDRTAVKSWLVRIATRKALDHVRGQRPHDDIDTLEVVAPTAEGPDAAASASALSSSLQTALRTLPTQQRQVWALRELGEYSYDEIATELRLPPSTVRGLLARARRTLIQQMDHWR